MVAWLRDHIVSSRTDARRVLVALAGPPGSGKTTLAGQLARALNAHLGAGLAAVLPMDGFHYDNETLDEMGLRHRKGAPETFDHAGFSRLVQAVRSDDGPVSYPVFDRVADTAQPGARTLDASVRFAIFEGNYLLLQQGDWGALRELFDLTIMLRADPSHLRKRLVARWLEHGLSAPQAHARTDGNDMVNAALVQAHSAKPHLTLVIRPDDEIELEASDNWIRPDKARLEDTGGSPAGRQYRRAQWQA